MPRRDRSYSPEPRRVRRRSNSRDRSGRSRYEDERYRRDRRDRDYRRETRRKSPSRSPSPQQPTETPVISDDKARQRREKLESWRKERDAKKALGEATAKAMALAGKSARESRVLLLCLIPLDSMPLQHSSLIVQLQRVFLCSRAKP